MVVMNKFKWVNSSKQLGFTLIEVMLALAIFSIAGLALVSTANSNIRNTSHLEEKIQAGWIASNQMTQVLLERKWPLKNNAKGEVELASQIWYWRQRVIATTDNNMKAVVIEVRKEEGSDKPISSVMTYVAKDGK